jgi:hypothetical protein
MMPLHYMRSACLGELFHCCPARCSRGGKSCRRLAEIIGCSTHERQLLAQLHNSQHARQNTPRPGIEPGSSA